MSWKLGQGQVQIQVVSAVSCPVGIELSIFSSYFTVNLLVMSITCAFLHWKVTIDLELHLARGTKPKPSRGPFAHYDVYLCRVPRTNPRIPNGPRAQTVNSPGRAKGRVLRWEDDTYPPSPPCSICSPVSTQSLPAPTIAEPQGSRRWTLNPYSTWRTPTSLASHRPGCHLENVSVNVCTLCFVAFSGNQKWTWTSAGLFASVVHHVCLRSKQETGAYVRLGPGHHSQWDKRWGLLRRTPAWLLWTSGFHRHKNSTFTKNE